jgi:hypothetical protein
MEGGQHPDLVASWKAERRWFRWTVGFTAGLCLWLMGWAVALFWLNQHIKSSLAKSGSMLAEDLGPVFLVTAFLNILILIFSGGFLVSLIKWLLAIRCRRKVQVATGFPPRENH